MAKGYSTDLRDRVVALVEAGESRREAARLLDLAASTAICWIDRWQTTGSVAANLDVHRRVARQRPDSTLCHRWCDGWSRVHGLCRAGARTDADKRRHLIHGQSADAQNRWGARSHRRCRRDNPLSARLFARPQPNRDGILQTQSCAAQRRQAHSERTLAVDRKTRKIVYPRTMRQLFSPCRI